MLVILILATLYFTWLGFGLRKAQRYSYSWLAWAIATFLGFLAIAGFFKIV